MSRGQLDDARTLFDLLRLVYGFDYRQAWIEGQAALLDLPGPLAMLRPKHYDWKTLVPPCQHTLLDPDRNAHMPAIRFHHWLLFLVLLGGTSQARSFASDGDDDKFFEAEVRPLLVENCVKCHGPAQQKGGLRLDTREGLFAGGELGSVVEPGHPEESLIVEAVRHEGLKMPPKTRLPADQVRVLERWVERGAHWPKGAALSGGTELALRVARSGINDTDRAWWAIQTVARPSVPGGADDGWVRNPIDAFVLTRLRDAGIQPAPEADRRTLIRRLSFDLIGLPPTPKDVEAFLSDYRPDAYEQLVDRLLDSPHYGERWARHWLDLVRYAESDGYKQDTPRPEAWRYRDYVIASFNEGKPYDRFVQEQLAGDELDPSDPAMRIATSFLRLWPYEYNQRDVEGQWATILNDLTDVTGDVFMGIGLSCARCHDHKFDPILQADYYRIQAFFAPLMPRDDLPLATDVQVADAQVDQVAWEFLTGDLRDQIAELERPHKRAARLDAIAKFQPHLQAILQKLDNERTPCERQLAYLMNRQLVEEFGNISARIKGKEKEKHDALLKELSRLDGRKPPKPPQAFSVHDVGTESPLTVIPVIGTAKAIEPGFLTILDPNYAVIETPAPGLDSTGRRLTLARWLTRPDHPLVPRVLANRVWQRHFGRGLVATPSDFGRLGERPSHPELLDWLAAELVENEWSLKHLHRLIVNSATYRQGRQADAAQAALALRADPDNRLLGRIIPARLDAESLRDAMLAASGEMDLAAGGPAAEPSQSRRSIYTRQLRNRQDPFLAAFDAPDGSASTPARNVTTSPTQALGLINGAWTIARAKAMALRLEREMSDDTESQIDRAYALALSRVPTDEERREALSFLIAQTARASDDGTSTASAAHAALVDFCHALLNSSAFLYVD